MEMVYMRLGFSMSRKQKQINEQVAQIPMVTVLTALASNFGFIGIFL